METVISQDGAPIAFQRSGKGPPLVLVHGTTADHTRWRMVLPALEQHFTVCALDRRGRGESGDGEAYDIELEFADVAAVVDAAGAAVHLLGHSFGALCAMEAALRTDRISKMVLYEPAFSIEGIAMYPPGSKEKFQHLLDQGDRDGLITAFFRDVVNASDAEIAALRSDPSWARRVASAHTIVREMGDEDYLFDPERFQGMKVPTLLLVGERSPRFLRLASERVAKGLPDARIVEMPGQAHIAMTTAPDLFVKEVIGFLGG